MESMGLERLDRPTSLALRTLQDLIMLKKTTADMSFVPALVYAGEFGPALAVGLLGSAVNSRNCNYFLIVAIKEISRECFATLQNE
jgi:hypothetical protein